LLANEAGIFVIVGTSLAVYPAAGLSNYIRRGIPIIILDKKIPEHNFAGNVTVIEKPATQGIADLIELLKKYH
jgi:NAD-dependent deacetylase